MKALNVSRTQGAGLVSNQYKTGEHFKPIVNLDRCVTSAVFHLPRVERSMDGTGMPNFDVLIPSR